MCSVQNSMVHLEVYTNLEIKLNERSLINLINSDYLSFILTTDAHWNIFSLHKTRTVIVAPGESVFGNRSLLLLPQSIIRLVIFRGLFLHVLTRLSLFLSFSLLAVVSLRLEGSRL